MPDSKTDRVLRKSDYDAVIFDLDGVITQSAETHFAAWKKLFDAWLKENTEHFRPFTREDYQRHVDGIPRYDGVDAFMRSRGIELPWGDPSDPPDRETVCGLGNRKNEYFHQALSEQGVEVYQTSVDLVKALQRAGIRTAIISASKNCKPVLEAAGVLDLFEVIVDGILAAQQKLPGKPDPAVFLEAARRLGVAAQRAVVVEDAQSGVKAGRAGGFALVIGVDRGGNAEALRSHGADIVVEDLGELTVEGGG